MKISGLLFISIRYIYTGGGGYISSTMSIISIVGTCLSVAILICILSIMNGFEDELKSRMLGPGAHLDILINQKSESFEKSLLSTLRKDKEVARADLVLEGDALLSFEDEFRSVTIRGMKPDLQSLEEVFSARLKDGSIRSFLNDEYGILIGHELADYLGASIGDSVTLVLPQPILSPVGLMTRTKRFRVLGVFKFDMNAPDASLAISHHATSGVFFPRQVRDNLISVRLLEAEEASGFAASLKSQYDVEVVSWKEKYQALFTALRIEKIVMFGMLLMAVFIALFNMASILLVNVTSKRKEIAILVSFGLNQKQAAQIFFMQGFVTGLVGITLGVLLGIFLSINLEIIVTTMERILGFRVLSPDIYYVSEVPSKLLTQDVVAVGIISVISVFFAALLPATLSVRLSKIGGLGRG